MTTLNSLLSDSGINDINSPEFTDYVDQLPVALPNLRGQFVMPTAESIGLAKSLKSKQTRDGIVTDKIDPIYFCGNSLGLMPLGVRALVNEELDIWGGRCVLGHFDHPLKRPWKDITDTVQESMARVVGAHTPEVAVMGSLTSNLHTLMSTFYRPNGKRTKILYEAKAFPSDQYAFASQVRLHGLNPQNHLIALAPRKGEYSLRTEDILSTIESNGPEIALVMFSGVQYYTGQFFAIPEITEKGHSVGAIVGWDLAHAVGNVPLQLHDWNVDFACWCNYKYLNAGPGAIAGIFVHDQARRPASSSSADEDHYEYENRLAGWWGHNAQTRFKMDSTFDPIPGAAGYQLSNPSVLNVVSLLASLNTFGTTSMTELRQKSLLLTAYLEHLLSAPATSSTNLASYTIITPKDPQSRGAQLSVLFQPTGCGVMEFVMSELLKNGIVADEREPDVIRLSPVPSYNTFKEVRIVAANVRAAVSAWQPQKNGSAGDKLTQTS